MKYFKVFGIILLIVIAGAAWHLNKKPALIEPIIVKPVYDTVKQLSYSFTLKNNTNRVLQDIDFRTYAPVQQTATQQCCEQLQASHAYQIETDALGNQVLYFKFGALPPYAVKLIRITTNMRVSAKPNLLATEKIQPFLIKEPFIETEHVEIKALARRLLAKESLQTAQRTYQWVTKNIQDVGYIRQQRGALYALQNKRGDCTEMAALFVALMRANHIPARVVSGYFIKYNGLLRANEYHEWAEFYEQGVWRIADPQKKIFDKNYAEYVALRIIDSTEHAIFKFARFQHSGNGLKVKMN